MIEPIGHALAILLILLGLSYLLLFRRWFGLVRSITAEPGRYTPLYLLMLLCGLFIGVGFNDWTDTWHIFVTAFGFLLAIEGALFAFFPGLLRRFAEFSDRFLKIYILCGGIVLIVLGGFLARHFFF
jgi:uncharacterized protein YjeT (DUF2065 family)